MIKYKKKICRGCKNLKWIWSQGYCDYCFKKYVKKPKKLKTYKIKRKFSKAYVERSKAYKQARLEYLEANPCCEVRLPDCTHCDPELLTIHHKKGRIGTLLTDKRYFLAACMSCHRVIETYPHFAKAQGWSESRLSEEDTDHVK